MGGFANSMLSIMLGWVKGAAATLWKALYTSEGSGFLQ